MQEQAISYGYCQCGCGQKTRISGRTSAEKGWVKGQPLAYINGHNRRKHAFAYEESESGCWEWLGSRTWNGYGQGCWDGRHQLAHRRSYEQSVGPIPDGMQLDHLCRNRACVNPAHLEPVTNTENVRRAPRTILTVGQVREIRASPRYRGSDVDQGREYGVSTSTINAIRAGRLWRST